MATAPIILFAYKRPALLLDTLRSLKANALSATSALTIYCDGPKADATADERSQIEEVRHIARSENWCGTVSVVESAVNKGLARSVIDGVTEAVNEHGRVIVIEDDVRLSPFFLQYMNDALKRFENDEKVLSIGSWNYFCDPARLPGDVFFLRYPDSIAWATYAWSWRLFEHDAAAALKKLRERGLMDRLNGEGGVDYFGNMLENQLRGRIDSWAIRWTATSVLHDKMNVYPKCSMSLHCGFGESATHEKTGEDYNSELKLCAKALVMPAAGEEVKETAVAFRAWAAFVRKNFLSQPASQGAIHSVKTILYRTYRKVRSIFLGGGSDGDRLIRTAMKFPRYKPLTIRYRRYRFHVPDFLSVAHQINEYFEEERQRINFDHPRPFIIDCGSNVGVSLAYFKSQYPHARILAFEADPAVFSLLKENVLSNKLEGIELRQAAVWIHSNGVEFATEGADGGSIYNAGDRQKVPSQRLTDVLKNVDRVDLLKMDIEGAETEVLTDCAGELFRVRNIFVEFHSYAAEPQRLDKLLGVLSGSGFRYYIQSPGTGTHRPFVADHRTEKMDLQLEIYAVRP